MDSEKQKQKETIHFLDSRIHLSISESHKQKEVILLQGKTLNSLQKELSKANDVIRLQGKLLHEKQKHKGFDEELYLFELYKLGTVLAYGKLASQTSLSYTVNSEKNREKIRKFRSKMELSYVIKKVKNGTIALVDYDEAKRLLKFGENND